MESVRIDDPADERIADYRHLRDADLRRRVEAGGPDGEGIFIAEGTLVIRRLLRSKYPVRSVLVAPGPLADLADDLAGLAAPVYLATREVMSAVAGFDLHRGAVAAASRLPLPSPAELLAGAGRVLVLEDIVDHENLGGLFRNAAAFGVDAVVLSPGCCDPLYRRSVRVSMGHVLGLPFARLEPWPQALVELRRHGLRLLALTPGVSARPLAEVSVGAGSRLALMVGSEGPGLSEAALATAEERVRIAMALGVDSLNVATAAAIALHHLAPPATP